MEVPVAIMRDAMEMCNKLIPMMNNEEMNQLGMSLIKVTERLILEGRVDVEKA
ncbi:hypothetical protein LGL08_20405 [Clostridium estertheticum]|uniref:hypothetical protein n=1 Tax=Clostridium estertheticum TaxID=238834 RepID=UPI001CF341FF|nr:hypothetical protein [Clostridium estertheticum]MCB2308856.1 hypothetical protein [Clostridium estertheticum]MCB2347268.1 hypothetical protein [Clostridium estertheticum]MCB2351891.1 hypothetical protein [Clostridium estertheticum]WAG48471.1 hypothetical protein LL127_23400 [Clostridium estertheticum]